MVVLGLQTYFTYEVLAEERNFRRTSLKVLYQTSYVIFSVYRTHGQPKYQRVRFS